MAQSYMEEVAKMPKELQEIVMENWDYTGRPLNHVANPKGSAIIAILNKNAISGGKSFLEDMKIVFPKMYVEEAAIYYNVYIEGMNKLKDMLIAGK